jgi:hypothetical protein
VRRCFSKRMAPTTGRVRDPEHADHRNLFRNWHDHATAPHVVRNAPTAAPPSCSKTPESELGGSPGPALCTDGGLRLW